MTRTEAISAALAAARENGINFRGLRFVGFINCDDYRLTISPAASKPFVEPFGSLNSDHVVPRSQELASFTVKAES